MQRVALLVRVRQLRQGRCIGIRIPSQAHSRTGGCVGVGLGLLVALRRTLWIRSVGRWGTGLHISEVLRTVVVAR